MLRPVALAFGFLTRIPVPVRGGYRSDDLSRSTWAFPLVGLVIGAVIAADLVLLQDRPIVGAWLAFILWVLLTGGLHLDGLADVVDGLAAAHGDPDAFRQVAKDPHIGGLGAVAIGVQLISTALLLFALAPDNYWALILVPAWARWGAVLTPVLVPPLGSGMAAAMGRRHLVAVIVWAVGATAVSIWLAPVLLVALITAPALAWWWRLKLGGANGDCIGAGIEITESVLLLALALW